MPRGILRGVLRRSALEALADQLLAERSDSLGPLRSVDRDRLVREFADLDERTIKNASHRVIGGEARRPTAILGLAAIIASEAQKKKKHMPVAHLLAKTAEVAQAIKPVFAMSPLTVSQFLSPDMRFDVVIFDEASQVRPCDAVNCLYRAGAMIVAGDQKQLPPTSFFDNSTDSGDEWNDEDLAEYGSVLDLAKGAGRFRSLLAALALPLSPREPHRILQPPLLRRRARHVPRSAQQSDDLGVVALPRRRYLPARNLARQPDRGQEGRRAVFAHAERGQRSIGVVTFSEAQASYRGGPQARRRASDPRFAACSARTARRALRQEPREVQGDERDVIVFSVGYGPDDQRRGLHELRPDEQARAASGD